MILFHMQSVQSDTGKLTKRYRAHTQILTVPRRHSAPDINGADGIRSGIEVPQPLSRLDIFCVVGVEAGHCGGSDP
jgi:hypothetical protein